MTDHPLPASSAYAQATDSRVPLSHPVLLMVLSLRIVCCLSGLAMVSSCPLSFRCHPLPLQTLLLFVTPPSHPARTILTQLSLFGQHPYIVLATHHDASLSVHLSQECLQRLAGEKPPMCELHISIYYLSLRYPENHRRTTQSQHVLLNFKCICP